MNQAATIHRAFQTFAAAVRRAVRREQMLADTIDMSVFIAEMCERHQKVR